MELKFHCEKCHKEISEKYAETTGLCFECHKREQSDKEFKECADCKKPINSKYNYCYSCYNEIKEAKKEFNENPFEGTDDDYEHESSEDHPYIQKTNWALRKERANRNREKYENYITSQKWDRKRLEKLREVGFKCEECGAKRFEKHLQAHHKTYDRLGNEELEDLIILCEDCHTKKHHYLIKIKEEFFKSET